MASLPSEGGLSVARLQVHRAETLAVSAVEYVQADVEEGWLVEKLGKRWLE